MLVVLAMAIHAGDGRILESRRSMAILAYYRCVLADQRERREFVVESHGGLPIAFAMACLAARSQLAAMFVVFGVAREAVGRQFLFVRR